MHNKNKETNVDDNSQIEDDLGQQDVESETLENEDAAIEEKATLDEEETNELDHDALLKSIRNEEQQKKLDESLKEEQARREARVKLELEKHEKKLQALQEKQLAFQAKAERRALDKSKSSEDKAVRQAEKQKEKILHNSKLSKKLRKKLIDIDRIEADLNVGLTEEQVNNRINQGLNNFKSGGSTKTISRIIVGNIFTFFNLLTFTIAGLLISVNSWKDLTFLIIVLANMVIGIIQEIRAKKTIDKLSLISAPTCVVLREGKKQEVTLEELVLDDLLYLENGKQICSDSIVLDGTIEVNESLLTGEADAILKHPGDTLYSGSFVVSGHCLARVDKVGGDNYIERLTGQAKKYKKPNSELLKSLTLIIRVMAFLVVGIGVGLYLIQRFRSGMPHVDAIRKTAGAMIGMIPSGLYLVTSVALSVGVLRLAKNNVLVQELYCIEMLARVDVLCLDKTGTITDGSMNVRNVIDYNLINGLSTKNVVSALLNATNDKNLTNVALEEKFGRGKRIKHLAVIPFSSQRKYSAATFEDYGTFVIGAPEFVLKTNFNKVAQDVNRSAKEGYRVLVIAHTNKPIVDEQLPNVELEPISLIMIEDNVRPDAVNTINYFKSSGVEVKVISGDNPITVAKVSERAGIENADQYISLDGLTDTEVVRAAAKYTVFGRVSPAQKRLLVKTLHELGHTVAMTGDGVNDILALKEADCSIAVASGSEAARNVSHLVLLDSNFDSMPKVVAEGRRVINNVAKVSRLYLTKTIFSLLLAIEALISGTYPISTNQLLMIDFLCIGLPSVVLVLEANNAKNTGHFLSTVIKSALPGAVVILIQSILVFALQNSLDMTARTTSTIIVITATFTCMMVLFETCKPFNNNVRRTLFGGVFTVFIFASVFIPSFFDFSPIIPGLSYYQKSEEIMTWDTQNISVSVANHYIVDGYVLDELCSKQTQTHAASVNSNGYLVIDNMTTTTYKPNLPLITESIGNKFSIGAHKTSIDYNENNQYAVTVQPDGDVYIEITYTNDAKPQSYSTGYNILPNVTISNSYYYINGNLSSIRTEKSSVGKVYLDNNYDVMVSGNKIGTLFDGKGLLISHRDSSIYLNGSETEIDFYPTYSKLSINSACKYVIDDVETSIAYAPEIATTEGGYYIVNGYITQYKSSGNSNSISQSISSDGYLKINGTLTDIKLENSITTGGQVSALPVNCVILLICMCLSSHPLIALIKGVVPFSKKQIKKATDLLNKI